jgi:glucose/mannose-6-phosphate isomerase
MASMKTLINNFPQHLAHGLQIASDAQWKNSAKRFKAILITGLGGSGIGGSLASEWMGAYSTTPILVNKDYHLPAWVDEHALIIACSYSGNTEETLSAMQQALDRNAEVAVITSGGKVKELAETHGLNAFIVPGGNPPRSMMGYSVTGLMAYLEFYGLNTPEWREAWQEAIGKMRAERDAIYQQSATYAKQLFGKYPVVYATDGLAALAERIRQQFNENSKMLGWAAAIPEMNHNELVGWAGGNDSFAVVMLRHSGELQRNAIRAEINKDLLRKRTPHLLEWRSEAKHPIAQALCLSYLADWTSYHLSELNQVDIMDIEVIDFLKSELGKI